MAETGVKYRTRRKRSENPPTFQLTSRDIEILRVVARYRFLHSGHIRMLIAGSKKNIANRLKALFEHRYLDRPECQYDFYRPGGGSSLTVYALADRGTRLLANEDGDLSQKRCIWNQKNREVGRPFLKHTLAIADFATSLSVAVSRRSDIDLLDGRTLEERLPDATKAEAQPFRLNVTVSFKTKRYTIGVEPDYSFSLGFPELGRRAYFLVEVDRGTMPIARADLHQSSILRKFLAYEAILRGKLHTTHFGWRSFRVLFVTTNQERATNMREGLKEVMGGRGSPLFWFTDRDTLTEHTTFGPIWIDGVGNRRGFMPAT